MWTEDLSELTAEDIDQLVIDEATENETREYKQELPPSSADDRREFLYDVSALANTSGGFLIFGIAEKRDAENKPTGIAGAVTPLAVPNLSAEIARLENLIRDSLSPRLTGVVHKPITVTNGNVLVMSIPKSWNGPHMVVAQHVNKFYGRVSSGKYLMSVDQLRRAFNRGSALHEAITTWRQHRINLLKSERGPIPLASGPKWLMHLIPASAFDVPTVSSTWKVSQGRRIAMHCPTVISPQNRYNADGLLKWVDMGPGEKTSGYTQLFRNGVIEYVSAHFSGPSSTNPASTPQLFISHLEREIVKGYQDALQTYKELQITEPLYASVSMFGIAGHSMYLGWKNFLGLRPMHDNDFESPEILIDHDEPNKSLQVLADLMWQAGGLETSPLVTDGKWNPFGELDR